MIGDRRGAVRGLAGIILLGAIGGGGAAAACEAEPAAFQAALTGYLEERSEAEGITAASATIACAGDSAPVVVTAGTRGRDDPTPIDAATMFQIGSNTKHVTAALLALLAEDGALSLDDTVGDHLPQYPFWADVSIRALLDMTSPIPTYSEVPAFMAAYAAHPEAHHTLEELVDVVVPDNAPDLPPNTPWFYSNTNYILAGMIIEAVTGETYETVLQKRIIAPLGLTGTRYFPEAVPGAVQEGMAHGYFENPACDLYAPDCETASLAPLVGKDVRGFDLSWAGPAGGIISTPTDLAAWVRALFGGKVMSAAMLGEMTRMVSMKTGEPIADVSAEDPRGFALGLVRIYAPETGAFWFYQGETLGYRAVFAWFADDDVLITFALNSQPPEDENHAQSLATDLYRLATR
ncbi:serine hydrolase domain-containing protein [Acuticoccus mangrovi]|uniref:Beta-lactamase family protein n=1 Tax=Acuticoccus mangrovi TaxID=2796142 RepID=A0A934IN13_9HYPH|nr:serine hydrolase domain-containing protein [Acuticoccus mangrovi]MBJ3775446.1 beta-lactamase family protein [Acuticoccus mangrovi]